MPDYYTNFTNSSDFFVDDDIEETDDTNIFGLSLIGLLVGFNLVLVIIICFSTLKRPADENENMNNRNTARRQESKKTKRRSQEFIEKMLVLKKVLCQPKIQPSQSCDKYESATTNRAIKTVKRKKSNLILDDEEEEATTCPICLCDYEDGDQICWSYNENCQHSFHAECGIAWLAKHSDCPICRAEYLVDPEAARSELKTTEPDQQQQEERRDSITTSSETEADDSQSMSLDGSDNVNNV